jgi:hypothetical protein
MTDAAKNIQELSDEEFLEEFAKHREEGFPASNQDSDPGVPEESQASEPAAETEGESEETGGAVSGGSEAETEGDGEVSSSEESTSDDGNDEPDEGETGARADPHQGSDTSDQDPDSESKSTKSGTTEAEQLAELLAPLKAAKRTIQIDSVEKARQLMQMGVDYSRKMADLKPYQRMMTSLERAGLLEEDKLNHLIDLHNKRPEAIQKLLKDSDIDPLDLDLEDNADYRPNDHMVPEGELAVDQVLDTIRTSPKFNDVVNTVQSWDTASKRALMDNPQVFQHLAAHMEAGIYDMIMDRLESDKIFGKHVGLSDLDAYKAVGDAMHEEGAFNKAPNAPAPSAAGSTDQGSSQDSQGSRESIKARKRAASPPKGGAGKGMKKQPDFSKMTDEEIENYDWRSALT